MDVVCAFPGLKIQISAPATKTCRWGPRTWGIQLWITAGDWVRAFPPKRSLDGAPMFVRMDALIKKACGFPHGWETHSSR
jgi:hypothetical protein